jgi:hypothetical protein
VDAQHRAQGDRPDQQQRQAKRSMPDREMTRARRHHRGKPIHQTPQSHVTRNLLALGRAGRGRDAPLDHKEVVALRADVLGSRARLTKPAECGPALGALLAEALRPAELDHRRNEEKQTEADKGQPAHRAVGGEDGLGYRGSKEGRRGRNDIWRGLQRRAVAIEGEEPVVTGHERGVESVGLGSRFLARVEGQSVGLHHREVVKRGRSLGCGQRRGFTRQGEPGTGALEVTLVELEGRGIVGEARLGGGPREERGRGFIEPSGPPGETGGKQRPLGVRGVGGQALLDQSLRLG